MQIKLVTINFSTCLRHRQDKECNCSHMVDIAPCHRLLNGPYTHSSDDKRAFINIDLALEVFNYFESTTVGRELSLCSPTRPTLAS